MGKRADENIPDKNNEHGAGKSGAGRCRVLSVVERNDRRVEDGRYTYKLGVTESGRKRNWVEGQKGKVDQTRF
jgi:hypothetical protein